MGQTSRSIEDSAVKSYLNYEGLAQDVSEEQNINIWPRDHSCDILVKKLAAFCPCLSLPETKVKSFRLIMLAEGISKQPCIDSIMGFLVVTLMKIYNEKEQTEQSKLQNVKFEEKRGTRKWNGTKSYVQEDKQIKKRNIGSSDLRARSNSTKFPTCEKE